MRWRVAVIGHSIVRDLASLRPDGGPVDENLSYDFKFFFKSGACFETFFAWPPELENLIARDPDLVFVILGSNSVQTDHSVKALIQNAYIFYEILRNNLRPNARIVQCQIESRFLTTTDRHGNPPKEVYRRLRNKANKALLKCPKKDHFCMVGGRGRRRKIVPTR